MDNKFIVLLTSFLLLVTMLSVACASKTKTPCTSTGRIHVRVTDTGNNPLRDGTVVLDMQPGGQLKLEGLTNNNGDVVFQNVKSEDYEFYISRFNYTETYITIIVKPGQTTSTTRQMTISNPQFDYHHH